MKLITVIELLLQSAWRIKIYVTQASQCHTKLSNNFIKNQYFCNQIPYQVSSVFHLRSCAMNTGGSFPEVEERVKQDTKVHLVPKLRVCVHLQANTGTSNTVE